MGAAGLHPKHPFYFLSSSPLGVAVGAESRVCVPPAVQEERQRSRERSEAEAESTSGGSEDMPVERILEAELAVEPKTETCSDLGTESSVRASPAARDEGLGAGKPPGKIPAKFLPKFCPPEFRSLLQNPQPKSSRILPQRSPPKFRRKRREIPQESCHNIPTKFSPNAVKIPLPSSTGNLPQFPPIFPEFHRRSRPNSAQNSPPTHSLHPSNSP